MVVSSLPIQPYWTTIMMVSMWTERRLLFRSIHATYPLLERRIIRGMKSRSIAWPSDKKNSKSGTVVSAPKHSIECYGVCLDGGKVLMSVQQQNLRGIKTTQEQNEELHHQESHEPRMWPKQINSENCERWYPYSDYGCHHHC